MLSTSKTTAKTKMITVALAESLWLRSVTNEVKLSKRLNAVVLKDCQYACR